MNYYINKETNSHYQMAGEAPSGAEKVSKKEYEKFVKSIEIKAKPSKKAHEFKHKGLLLSLTKDDQDGLTAVVTAINQGFKEPINFMFSNGAKLELSKGNAKQFFNLWMKKRQSIFEAENG